MDVIYPVNLEREARASFNYLENLIDRETGFTYFDVFLDDFAEAVHDWPDFLDVPGRTAETCVLLRHMTGSAVATEDACFRRIYCFQEENGLFLRPDTDITHREYIREEQALVMGALLAKAIGDQDEEAKDRLARLIIALNRDVTGTGSFPAMLIRPVTRAYEEFRWSDAEHLMTRLIDAATHANPIFREDGGFKGHVHSHLYAATGLTEAGRITDDSNLMNHMGRVFEWIRERSSSFGFVPEVAEREDDVIGCETCCLMDYIHLALSQARTGRTEFFDDAERAVRNHLIESRVRHGEWLPSPPNAANDNLIRRSSVGDAAVGAYAGWSSPNHILAYDEWLPDQWIKSPELAPIFLHKVRALQNCCGPSGPKALHIAWQHAAQIVATGGEKSLRVNLLLDRSLPEAEIRSHEPLEGCVEIYPREPLTTVALRCPSWVNRKLMTATLNGTPVPLRIEDGYAVVIDVNAANRLVIRYPLEEREERVVIGNEGRQSYGYQVRWRGGTVIRMTPEENPETGVSHLMPHPVRLYYGRNGMHELYARENILVNSRSPQPLRTTSGPRIW